jgi:hypothetical protein
MGKQKKCSDSDEDMNSLYSDISSVCDESDRSEHTKTRITKVKADCLHKSSCYDPGVSYFMSVVTPLSNLTPGYSGCTGVVEFRMRRKNKTVTLQWEPFTGTMAASGVAYLTVAQSISNTPPYPVSIPIYIKYKSVGRVTHLEVDPASNYGNIRFYLNTDGSATDIVAGDSVEVLGGSATWIVQ